MSVKNLARALAPKRTEYQGSVIKGVVTALRGAGSVDLNVRGTVVPDVRHSPALSPAVGHIAVCIRNDVDLIVSYFEPPAP